MMATWRPLRAPTNFPETHGARICIYSTRSDTSFPGAKAAVAALYHSLPSNGYDNSFIYFIYGCFRLLAKKDPLLRSLIPGFLRQFGKMTFVKITKAPSHPTFSCKRGFHFFASSSSSSCENVCSSSAWVDILLFLSVRCLADCYRLSGTGMSMETVQLLTVIKVLSTIKRVLYT